MPCDTVTTVSLTLDKCDPKIMMQALAALGLVPTLVGDLVCFGNRESINYKTGAAQVSSYRDIAEIKRQYSRQAVASVAAKRGWTIKTDAKNQNKMTVFKR